VERRPHVRLLSLVAVAKPNSPINLELNNM
jgi:hypothetical protein